MTSKEISEAYKYVTGKTFKLSELVEGWNMKYRKKPVVIEAVQLSRKYFFQAMDFVPKEMLGDFGNGEFQEDSCYLEIKTLEGVMTASEGDWIIKGVNGEFYPIKNDIFLKTYELVEENQ